MKTQAVQWLKDNGPRIHVSNFVKEFQGVQFTASDVLDILLTITKFEKDVLGTYIIVEKP